MKIAGIKLNKKQEILADLMQEIKHNLSKKTGLFDNLFDKISGKNKAKTNLYVYGGVGRGKTIIAKAFYDELNISKNYIHYQNFMKEIHSMLHAYKGFHKPNILKKVAKEYAKQYKFLVIDEFEVHDITDAMIIRNLFKAFLKEGIRFLITTNIEPENLYQNGLQRESFLPFIALIKKEFEIFHLDGQHDYRLDKIAEDRRLFYPNNKEVMKKIDKIRLDLIGDHNMRPFSLKLFGRELKLKHTFHDILFTDFDELCKNPISANDFVEIANHFSVIIMENVPKIAKDETDYALRFINFIDNIYFNKVLLFISLADEPEKIYPQGKRVKEFKRTISRLYEMSSINYYKNSKHK